MENSLTALNERRKQIKSQMSETTEKFIQARFSGASIDEIKAIATQSEELEKKLDDLDAEISRIQKAQREEELRLEAEKRKADEQDRLERERQKQEQTKNHWTDAESKLKRQKYVDEIIDSLKVQIMPSTECVEPNDAFVKRLFLIGPNSFKKALQGKDWGVKEKKATQKKGAIWSKLKIQNAEGYEDDNPLTEFDRAVLGVLISEFLAGNRYTTINIIFRALIGKIGKACEGVIPNKNQQDAIVSSVIKLMGTIVDFSSVTESLQEMNYADKDGNTVVLKADNLLSASLLDAKINGQVMEGVIFFKDNSPLFKVADAKCQVIRYPHQFLNVPNQNNTPRIISLKKYVMRRICEIKLHKNLTPTITFDDVFSRCRISNCPRNVKMDARNAIVKLCEHLKSQNFISDFEPVQQRGKFVSVKFSL